MGVDVTEAAAERVDMIGALVADTMLTVAVLEAAGTVTRVEAAEAGAVREMGATDTEARIFAAETAAAEEITGEEEMVLAGTEECSATR